jgi:hypothetical protein
MKGKVTFEDYFKEKEPQLINLAEKHLQTCEKTKKFTAFLDQKNCGGQIYDNEETLKVKQYSELALEKIRSWELINRINLPDLREEKKVGVVKALGIKSNIIEKLKIKTGIVSDELIFLITPSPQVITSQELPSLLAENSKELNFFHTD